MTYANKTSTAVLLALLMMAGKPIMAADSAPSNSNTDKTPTVAAEQNPNQGDDKDKEGDTDKDNDKEENPVISLEQQAENIVEELEALEKEYPLPPAQAGIIQDQIKEIKNNINELKDGVAEAETAVDNVAEANKPKEEAQLAANARAEIKNVAQEATQQKDENSNSLTVIQKTFGVKYNDERVQRNLNRIEDDLNGYVAFGQGVLHSLFKGIAKNRRR